jgi:phospholipid/cholesterol/gamma-HCH transport system ATP-binding protein
MATSAASAEPVIELQGVCTRFGAKIVHDGLDLEVRKGEIFAIVG